MYGGIGVSASSLHRESLIHKHSNGDVIRESLCRDGADTPMPPYIGKAFTRTNFEDLSLFRYIYDHGLRVILYPMTLPK